MSLFYVVGYVCYMKRLFQREGNILLYKFLLSRVWKFLKEINSVSVYISNMRYYVHYLQKKKKKKMQR